MIVQREWSYLVVCCALAVGCSSQTTAAPATEPASAATVAEPVHRAPESILLSFVRDVDLTASQQERLAAIRNDADAGRRALAPIADGATQEMHAELFAPRPDVARLHAATDRALAAHAAFVRRTNEQVIDLVRTFSPAQRAQLLARRGEGTPRVVSPRELAESIASGTQSMPAGGVPSAARVERLGVALVRDADAGADKLAAQSVRRQLRRDMRANDRHLDEASLRIATALAQPQPDAADIRAVIDDVLDRRGQAVHRSVDGAARWRASLSETQVNALATR